MKGSIALVLPLLVALLPLSAQQPEVKDAVERGKGLIRPAKEVRDKAYKEAFAKHGNKTRAMAAVAKAAAPAEFDCRDAKWVQDWAGDQSSCGSCYLYATAKQIRDALVKSGQFTNEQIESAIQYLMDRPRNFGGCNGGWGWEVASWVLKNGMPAEWYIDSTGKKIVDYPPYEARSGNDRTRPGAKIFHLEDMGWVNGDQNGDNPPTLDEFKACMLAYGPINFALGAGGSFGSYSDGVITSLSRNIDHEIRAIGWSDSKKAVLVYNQWRGWGIGGKGLGWISYTTFFRDTVDQFWVKAAGGVPPPPPPPPPDPTPGGLFGSMRLTLDKDTKAGGYDLRLVGPEQEVNEVGTKAKLDDALKTITDLQARLIPKKADEPAANPPAKEEKKEDDETPEPPPIEAKRDAKGTVLVIAADMTYADWRQQVMPWQKPVVVAIDCDPPLDGWLAFRAPKGWGSFKTGTVILFTPGDGTFLWEYDPVPVRGSGEAIRQKLRAESKFNPYSKDRDPKTGKLKKAA